MKTQEPVQTLLDRLNESLIKQLSSADRREERISAILEEAKRSDEFYNNAAFRSLVNRIDLEIP